MEKRDLKIEVLAPTSIESEVPKQQILRAPEESTPDKSVDAPTSTTDVTENRGPTDWSPRGLLRPAHVGEPERPPRVWRQAPEPPENREDRNPDDKRTKSRIPVSRFKTAVQKVQKERRESGEKRKVKKQAPEKPPRQSSIPKLRESVLTAMKNAYKSQADEQIDKTNDTSCKNAGIVNRIPVLTRDNRKRKENGDKNSVKGEISEDTSNVIDEGKNVINVNEQLEDEFDKLYEEIVDNGVEVKPIEILDTKVKDPEKLEIKFEEIVHQYDEQVKVEPTDKARYSKIPLLKRRSEQDIKVPKQHERRLSLRTSYVNKVDKLKHSEPINNDIVKINVQNKLNDKENTKIEINNNDQNKDDVIEQHPLIDTLMYNIMPTPEAELVKVGISHLDRALGKHDKDELETNVPNLDESFENNVTSFENNLDSVEVKDSEHTENPIVVNEDAITQVDNPEVNQETENSISIANDTLSDNNVSEDNIVINKNDTLKTAVVNYDDTPNEFKSVKLLRSVNSIEERSKSRFINKPIDTENDKRITAFEEDIPIVKGRISRILNRLTLPENTNNDDINDTNNKCNDEIESSKHVLPTKGNVSKIWNRITSQDIEQSVKKEFNEIPKKTSVLSKIALFERPDREPVVPKKPITKYTKPQRTISEEIKHSPKIVHEVLKPSIRNGQTDRHEVVTIDIFKPIEIVTNNEEQVLIVDDLEEQTIVYENLDEHVREIDTIENDPPAEVIMDETNLTTSDITPPIKTDETIVENDTHDNRFYAIDPKIDSLKIKEVISQYIPVKEKINRLQSYEENNMKRAQSTAELDLGDAVKGKVRNMIYKMNSSEMLDKNLDNKQKERISIKERPWKRSVLEKIALFENKLTPVKMEAVDNARALDIDARPADSLNSLRDNSTLEEEYNAKIKALVNAKLTYGSTNATYMELADGSQMPVLALGTALLDSRLAKYIVGAAIDLGFRAIDTAYIYGNEKEVGEGIRAKIKDGTVKREDLFIINKLWSTFHRPELVEPACRASLRALGLDYFDLYMIHNPMSLKEGGDPFPKIANVLQFSSHDYLDAWFAMERLVPHLARRIGVSNFNSAQIARVLDKGRVAPVVDQVECHPYLNQQRLSAFCAARAVKLSCFGTLGSKGTPDEFKNSQAAVIDDPLVKVMAAGLGVSPAQLLISYQLHCGHGVVVKGSSAAHLWDDLQAPGVSLTAVQVEALHALNRNKRTFTFKGMGDTHRNYPFKEPF